MRVRFGDCAFDPETRELFRAGKAVHLSPKAFRMLELLIAARPRALSKQELSEQLWPDTFVSEGNLASLAADIRAAVGEKARESGPLRTVYGFGYAFSGEALPETSEAPAPAGKRHWLIWNEQEIPLSEGENILGRDRDAEARIDDTTVSRHHARILVAGESHLEDLQSKNGTSVNGKPANGRVRLSDGDEIELGSVFLTFRETGPEQSTETLRKK
jgi:DNA-binding winged helix-turn-helix (wHTH) protein